MSSVLIKNANVVLRNKVLNDHCVYCERGKIESIMPSSESADIHAEQICDAEGFYLAPGYIDLHIHGLLNNMADRGGYELQEISKSLPRYGVTGFLAALTPKSDRSEELLFFKDISRTKPEGAQLLGFFLEGHFLHLTGAISHLPQTQTKQFVEDVIKALRPYKVAFGVSPEIEGIDKLIPHMTRDGFPAFITHTSATAEQTKKAIAAGALHATHFYDVFPYIGDREGGVRGCGTVEAIMASLQTSVDFILDGEHVEPIAVEMALACKGPGKVCLISDANINAGLPPGKYKGISGIDVEMLYEGGPARRLMPDSGTLGGLVGSGLTLDKAVRNAVHMLGVSIPQAVAMASANPAEVLKLDSKKGFIKKGFDADMVMLDKDLNVKMCWVGGKNHFTA